MSISAFAAMQTNGDWQNAFPMPIRVTSAIGETVEDKITSTLPPSRLQALSHCDMTVITCSAQPGSVCRGA